MLAYQIASEYRSVNKRTNKFKIIKYKYLVLSMMSVIKFKKNYLDKNIKHKK